MKISLRLLLVLVLAALCTTYVRASLSAVYVSQSGAGSTSGADCSNAKPLSFFNTFGNWGSGAGQIGPDTTVHACGTFSGGAGATGFVFQGSGTAGHPITLIAESGMVMTAPYWGTNDGTSPTAGAITANGLQYVTIDGGSNGIIRNTANGTALTYQQISGGIIIDDTSHVIVKNWNLLDIYQRTPCSADPVDPHTISVLANQTGGSAMTDIQILSNTFTGSHHGIIIEYGNAGGGISNVTIQGNHFSQEAPAINFSSRGAGSILTTALIDANTVTDTYYWWDPGDFNHLNGFHLFASGSGTVISGVTLSNNYIHGDYGGFHCGAVGHETSHMYIEGTGGGTITGTRLFNNITISEFAGDYPSGGWLGLGQGNTYLVANNLIGSTVAGQTNGAGIQGGDNATIKNNIFMNMDNVLYENGSCTITASNFNLYYGVPNGWHICSSFYTYAQWQALGNDANSINGVNPNLNSSTFVPSAGSAPIGNATNLSGLGITALNSDYYGISRGSAWDIGIAQFTGALTPPATRPRVNNSSLTPGTVGTPYTPVSFTATGGMPSYSWSAAGLPMGLFQSAAGILSGTPTLAGQFSPSITVRDIAGQTANVVLPLTIAAPVPPPVPPPPPAPATPTGYTLCATELGTCSFTGTRNVAYGANGVYVYKDLTGGTACTNGVFGDPLSGITKACYVKNVLLPPPPPPPPPVPAVTTKSWTSTCTIITKSDNSAPALSCTIPR